MPAVRKEFRIVKYYNARVRASRGLAGERLLWLLRHHLGDYGRKIAGNWDTFGTGQTKEHGEQFQQYLEDPKNNPVPDGYTAPFCKADRIGEYRQAHAAFSARLAATTLQGPGQQTEGDQ
jgi:hypothetical protein